MAEGTCSTIQRHIPEELSLQSRHIPEELSLQSRHVPEELSLQSRHIPEKLSLQSREPFVLHFYVSTDDGKRPVLTTS